MYFWHKVNISVDQGVYICAKHTWLLAIVSNFGSFVYLSKLNMPFTNLGQFQIIGISQRVLPINRVKIKILAPWLTQLIVLKRSNANGDIICVIAISSVISVQYLDFFQRPRINEATTFLAHTIKNIINVSTRLSFLVEFHLILPIRAADLVGAEST